MKGEKNLLLTFDYEPFLGARSGSVSRCLLEPADALCDIMDKYNASGVFFIDTLFLEKLSHTSQLAKEYELVATQIKKLHSKGHYVFPHIHPHWLDATYVEAATEFSLADLSHYSLASIDISLAEKVFDRSISLLRNLGIDYQNWGYRAGGWCIQPFERYKAIFEKNHIKYEFSVLPGYENPEREQFLDFTSVKDHSPYRFSSDVTKEDSQGPFIEFPISTISFTKKSILHDKIVRKFLWHTNDRGWGDGISAKTAAMKSNADRKEMLSIELLTSARLGAYKKFLRENHFMHWISHPKMFTRHGLKTFGRFMDFAANNFKLIFDFTKMIPSN